MTSAPLAVHAVAGSDGWIGRFAVTLMQLRADVTLPAAVARALQAQAHRHELTPERAARIDAAVRWRSPGAPSERLG